jgi:ABC-type dipeptide/oligopeptide/nickel transport system permease subunit
MSAVAIDDVLTRETATFAQRSLVGDAWRRLLRNKLAVASLAVICLLALVAVLAPQVAPYDPGDTDFSSGAQYQGMTLDHPFGTDGIGRDWMSRLIYGTRTSLGIGVLSQLLILAIALPIGLLAGYIGGIVDSALMRIADFFYAFPSLLFVLLVFQVLGPSIYNIIIAIAVVGWVDIARLVRGQVLALRTTDYVLAARAVGASSNRIMARHLLPNTLGPVIVSATFGIPSAIFTEAALSFIGVGLPAGTPSWGTMISDGYEAIQGQQLLVFVPSTALALTLLAFTFLGDGLRDALDPRTR